ncbi:histidine kinase [Streptomyces sp. A1499]|uniref:sensor histidine kinase n=1 Tax=Streptomyces sp. A1499 TaxID=2563104 RepID=UPI00144AA4BE|nr:histidine kinase [Streptomyces sp. A1499]
MEWNLPRLTLGRLTKISSVTAFFLTWLADISVLNDSRHVYELPTNWFPVWLTGPLICLTLVGTLRSAKLSGYVIGCVTASLAATLWSCLEPPGVSWWGALETCGLLVLTIRATACSWRPSTAAAHTALLGAAVLALPLRNGSWRTFLVGSYVLTVALAVCIAMGCALRSWGLRRERAEQDVRHSERLALARDLHDLIAHHMTGIIVQANAARAVHATAPDKVPPVLDNIARSGTETLESMRRLVRALMKPGHAPLRFGDLLTELSDLVSAHSAVGHDVTPARLDVTAAARSARLSPEVELTVFRLVQEALANVRRHAPGTDTRVRVEAGDTRLRVTVTNTAPYHRAATPTGGRGGFGLLGVRKRVEAIDGTFRADRLPDGGWRVYAVFPRAAPTEAEAEASTGASEAPASTSAPADGTSPA